MRKLFGILAASALLFAGSTATAAPVATPASLALTITGIGTITISGNGNVSVTGTTVKVGANLVTQPSAIVVAVTGTSAVQSITATNIANGAGTFSLGGVTAQAAGEICPATPALGTACDVGGGIGGVMAVLGTINVRINGFVNIPVFLSTAGIGVGGSFLTGGSSISGDAGVWTTGTGVVVTSSAVTQQGNGGAAPLVLVTPTFVNAFKGLALLPLFVAFTLGTVSIPEPGTLLLLASGIAGLTLVGRRRR